ncbi:MAG: hypothetical protein CM15mP56_2100 [Alphaproteobacteria bacterium]|nr:MAG: hypothetical protein CM15mP56_2100 [Alphaproteobacteria bacterium]
MNFKEYSFLDKSILIKFPDDWVVKEQDDNLIKVSFPFGPYPTLDCYLSCFDNPKINTKDKIRQYLLNGIDAGKEVEKILDNVYVLKHKFKSEGDNLLLIKIISILKPRTFREVRFSLAWPDNEEANKIVSKISRTLDDVISKIKFSEVKTAFDELGIIKNKLDNLILQKNVFWEKLEISLPKRWIINNNNEKNFVNLELDKIYQLSLFFEYFEINISKKEKMQDEIVTSFLNEITKDVAVNDQKLVKAGEDSFLFSFFSIENNEGTQFKNHIWYRICIKDSKILIVSFVFSYKLKTKKIGEIYYNKINELIKSSELN